MKALEARNKSRKKFGLKPLTVEEFMALTVQIAELDAEQQEKKLQQEAAAAASSAKKENVFANIFNNVMEDTCESNFDCERPLVCCDFGFIKKCCANGNRVIDMRGQPATVPVPARSSLPPQHGRMPY